jgi:hypothetical protein
LLQEELTISKSTIPQSLETRWFALERQGRILYTLLVELTQKDSVKNLKSMRIPSGYL